MQHSYTGATGGRSLEVTGMALPASDSWVTLATRHMQRAAVPKLLPPPEMSRGIQHVAARKVQGRLLAGLEQRDGRILVSSSAGLHTAPRAIHRAQHTCRLARRLPLHKSYALGANRPGQNYCARRSGTNRNGYRPSVMFTLCGVKSEKMEDLKMEDSTASASLLFYVLRIAGGLWSLLALT